MFYLTVLQGILLASHTSEIRRPFKKKKKKSNLQLSCLWPICFAHRDKRFIHDLALLMSLEKSLLCAE